MNIQITDQERAQNVAFQIKQLVVSLSTSIKPQIVQALSLLTNGAEGLTVDSLEKALGKETKANIVTLLETVNKAI